MNIYHKEGDSMDIAAAIQAEIAGAKHPSARARELRTMIMEALSAAAGEGIEVWNGRDGSVAPIPGSGWLLDMHWANEDQSYSLWFASAEPAKARLRLIAEREGREPSLDGLSADLTLPGCVSSYLRLRPV